MSGCNNPRSQFLINLWPFNHWILRSGLKIALSYCFVLFFVGVWCTTETPTHFIVELAKRAKYMLVCLLVWLSSDWSSLMWFDLGMVCLNLITIIEAFRRCMTWHAVHWGYLLCCVGCLVSEPQAGQWFWKICSLILQIAPLMLYITSVLSQQWKEANHI